MDFRIPLHPMSGTGEIQLILGPMFSGKTTELLRRIRRYRFAKRRCLLVKYANDVRYDDNNHVTTHDKEKQEAVSVYRLSEVDGTNFDVIGVDESQFYPDLVCFCERMANEGKIVIAAGLDGSFERRPFVNIVDLIPLCESMVKLTAICMGCNGTAAFTSRTSKETASEVIGGSDKYMSTCRKCHMLNLVRHKS